VFYKLNYLKTNYIFFKDLSSHKLPTFSASCGSSVVPTSEVHRIAMLTLFKVQELGDLW